MTRPQIVSEKRLEKKKRKRRRIKNLARNVAVSTVLILGSGTAGVTFLETPVQVGPHEGGVTLTYDGQLTIEATAEDDTEATSITRDVDTPLGLGAHVRVDDLPLKFTKNSIVPTKISASDLEAYASFFANYEQDIQQAQKEIRRSFEVYAALGMGAFLTLKILETEMKRRNLKKLSKTMGALGMALVAVAGAAPLGRIVSDRLFDNQSPAASSLGLPLAGFGIEGRLREFIKADEEAYDVIEKNLIKHKEKNPSVFPTDETTSVLIIEGLKCNTGMVRIVGKAADLYKPAIVLSAGDNQLGNHSLFDEFCMNVFQNQLKGHDILEADGYHSAIISEDEAQKSRITKLKGKVVESAGLRVLGVQDKYPTDGSANDAVHEELGEKLADRACTDEEGINIALGNQPSNVKESFRRMCADLIVAGGIEESYKVVTSATGDQVVYYLIGSSGGAVYSDEVNFATLGPLKAPASFAFATFDDTEDHRLLGIETLTAHPGDGKITSRLRLTAAGDSFLTKLEADRLAQPTNL